MEIPSYHHKNSKKWSSLPNNQLWATSSLRNSTATMIRSACMFWHVWASSYHSLDSLACAVTNVAKTLVPNKRRHSKLWLDVLSLASSLVCLSWCHQDDII